jgi:uncharacterized protein YbjT (DUF2867 family)
MLVLITGGTGYVGSRVVAALTKAGHRVRILTRSPGSVTAALAPLGVATVDTRIGDVTDPGYDRRSVTPPPQPERRRPVPDAGGTT